MGFSYRLRLLLQGPRKPFMAKPHHLSFGLFGLQGVRRDLFGRFRGNHEARPLQDWHLKRGHMGDYIGSIIGLIKGDTSSLDYGSYGGLYGTLLVIGVPRDAIGLHRSLLT